MPARLHERLPRDAEETGETWRKMRGGKRPGGNRFGVAVGSSVWCRIFRMSVLMKNIRMKILILMIIRLLSKLTIDRFV